MAIDSSFAQVGVSLSYGRPVSVPEHGSFSLLGLGLAGLGFMRRRKTT